MTKLIGFNNWSGEEKWAYWANHVNHIRFQFPPSPMYQTLWELVSKKNYFVITTNVDGMFQKTGFAEDRIFTPQGDYARYQCIKSCTQETRPTEPSVDRISPNIDPETFAVTEVLWSLGANCGGPGFLNVRVDAGFIEEPYEKQKEAYLGWLEQAVTKNLLVMEFGVGYNTPGIIRMYLKR
jgi:NAD-dependent SIR2 family protein deacetylase